MKEHATANELLETSFEPRKQAGQYYSAEFSLYGLESPYQFRIWNSASTPMCILVKLGSAILPRLQVGDRLNVKYHPHDSYDPKPLETLILHIIKNVQGRFKGYYWVGFKILESHF
jgi:hypothetical protein